MAIILNSIIINAMWRTTLKIAGNTSRCPNWRWIRSNLWSL